MSGHEQEQEQASVQADKARGRQAGSEVVITVPGLLICGCRGAERRVTASCILIGRTQCKRVADGSKEGRTSRHHPLRVASPLDHIQHHLAIAITVPQYRQLIMHPHCLVVP